MKKTSYIIFTLLCLCTLTLSVNAATSSLGFCQEAGIRKTFQIFGYALSILKILIPILLIVFGMIDFSKAIISSDGDSIKKSTTLLIKRAIAGVIVFLIPSIVWFVYSTLINAVDTSNDKYTDCIKCMTDPGDCPE